MNLPLQVGRSTIQLLCRAFTDIQEPYMQQAQTVAIFCSLLNVFLLSLWRL